MEKRNPLQRMGRRGFSKDARCTGHVVFQPYLYPIADCNRAQNYESNKFGMQTDLQAIFQPDKDR